MAVRANYSGTQLPPSGAEGYMMGLPSGGPAWTPPNNFGVTRARLTSGMKSTPTRAINGGKATKNAKHAGVAKKKKRSR